MEQIEGIDDIDSITAMMIKHGDARRSYLDGDAIAVKAIVALARTRNPEAMTRARELIVELNQATGR